MTAGVSQMLIWTLILRVQNRHLQGITKVVFQVSTTPIFIIGKLIIETLLRNSENVFYPEF